jgi:propanol-preferring alcohol dehydrogenase
MEVGPGLLPYDVPFTLGHENTGWVEELGAGVGFLERGQPVAVYGPWGCGLCRRCRLGMENHCERQAEIGASGGGLGRDGGMAPLLRVPSARFLVPLGDLDPVEAAPLTDAGLTPYAAIKRSLHLLTPGTTAVVIGVGGLGHLAVQLLRALSPAVIVAVDQRPAALALATEVGADHAVSTEDDAVAQLRALTGGAGAEVVLDFVGVDATLRLAAKVVRQLGHLTAVGIGGGSLPFGFATMPYGASAATTYWGALPELIELLELAAAGKVRAHVTRYPLDRATEAYAAMRDGTLEGRAVIVPNG